MTWNLFSKKSAPVEQPKPPKEVEHISLDDPGTYNSYFDRARDLQDQIGVLELKLIALRSMQNSITDKKGKVEAAEKVRVVDLELQKLKDELDPLEKATEDFNSRKEGAKFAKKVDSVSGENFKLYMQGFKSLVSQFNENPDDERVQKKMLATRMEFLEQYKNLTLEEQAAFKLVDKDLITSSVEYAKAILAQQDVYIEGAYRDEIILEENYKLAKNIVDSAGQKSFEKLFSSGVENRSFDRGKIDKK
jgi:regulator of replication initiation timing